MEEVAAMVLGKLFPVRLTTSSPYSPWTGGASMRTIVSSMMGVLLIGTAEVSSAATINPPVSATIHHAYSAFDQSGTSNHMYHSGLDYLVPLGTNVKVGVSGKIKAIYGLESGGGNNDCPNGQEKIYIWDENSTNSCAVNLKGGITSIDNCVTQCTNRTIDNSKLGISVVVAHEDAAGDETGHYSLYAHLSQVHKDIWDAYKCLMIDQSTNCGTATLDVNENTYIGRSGGSGNNSLDAWGYHLHYEVRQFEDLTAPGPYFSYTPDLPTGYGYEDPRSYYFDTGSSELFAGGKVIKTGGTNLRIRSGPGKKYSVLGWTGINQLLVADRKVTSTVGQSGGDKDVSVGRDWYRIQLPNSASPVHGWVAATADDSGGNADLLEEQTGIPIFTVVNASSTSGWPLVIDYSATTADPTLDCEERVSTLTGNNCVRVWDNNPQPPNHYLSAKVWNGTSFVVVPNQSAGAENQYDPTAGPGGREWYQVYLPSIYFSDPAATGCPVDLPDDQCDKADISRAWLPSNSLRRTASGRGMDFESGIDQAPIRSTIPGLEFSTTDGYDWIYGDWRAGGYNGPYPAGDYFSNGNFFAWLGANQGLGRIDFVGSTASALSLGYSSFAVVTLEACSNSLDTTGQLCSDGVGRLVDQAVGAGNLDTGRLDRLSVQDPSMDYVLFHDSGNFWLVDDLAVVDLLADTSLLVPSNYDILEEKMITTNDGGSTIINFLVDSFQSVKHSVVVILNWGGSEFRVKVYDPNGDLVAVRQSNSPPITLTVPIGDVGNWSAEIAAVDVPYDSYPASFIVASAAVGDLDGDGDVDRIDQSIFRSSLGKCAGDDGFVPATDYNADGCTDRADYRTWFGFLPPPPPCTDCNTNSRSSFRSERNFILSLITAGTGSGTVTADPTCCTYASGTTVNVTATPDANSSFLGWSGACSGTGSCVVTMDSDQIVIATFELINPTPGDRFDGNYSGSYIGTMDLTGESVNGAIALTITQGLINVTEPGSGSGIVDGSGLAGFHSANAVPLESHSFVGTFVDHGSGSVTGSGTWQALLTRPDGTVGTATGTWSVGRIDGTASPADVSGSWSGNWNSADKVSGGSVSANFEQSGTSFSGSVTIGGSPCISNGSVSGTISGSDISFGVVSGASTITFTATVTLDSMNGTYKVLDTTGFCAGDIGAFSMTR
jgi:hypothetical protein